MMETEETLRPRPPRATMSPGDVAGEKGGARARQAGECGRGALRRWRSAEPSLAWRARESCVPRLRFLLTISFEIQVRSVNLAVGGRSLAGDGPPRAQVGQCPRGRGGRGGLLRLLHERSTLRRDGDQG